jgi:hypothetical protein
MESLAACSSVQHPLSGFWAALASADVELFHDPPNHVQADSELLSNFVLAQVGPAEQHFSQPGIEAEAYLFDPGSQIDRLDLHSAPL